MKATTLTSMLFTGLLLASCQSPSTSQTDPVAARFSSVITKAVGTSWSANDKIGLFMTSSDNVSAGTILEGADNIAYQVTAAGTQGVFSPVNANEAILFPQDGSDVIFVAYYPYQTLQDYTLQVDVKEQSNQEKLDIMSATVTDKNKISPHVALNFTRAMSKVAINISSSVYSSSQIEQVGVKITELYTTADFTLSNRELTNRSAVSDITAKTITAGQSYEAILLPGDIASRGAKIKFSIAGTTLSYTIPTASFVQGKEYAYNLELGRTSVNSLNSTITDWIDDPTENNGTAE